MNTALTLAQAIDGYELAARARRLSPHTLADYHNTFRKLVAFFDDDPPLASITHQEIEEFLADQEVSKKTVLNYHTGLSALWSWAQGEGLAPDNILRRVERPRPEQRAIIPYSEQDVKAMLASLSRSKRYTRPGKAESDHALPNPERNRAVILLLLDTGLRASELVEARIHQVDLRNNHIQVFGKGDKERDLPFSPRTGQAIWKYLATRPDDNAGDLLITTEDRRPLDRHDLRRQLLRIGERAGVRDVTVHRFRHTFAINFLRNGGDPWTLQRMLGHTTMEMVRTYLEIAQSDLDANHRRASPVDHWRL